MRTFKNGPTHDNKSLETKCFLLPEPGWYDVNHGIDIYIMCPAVRAVPSACKDYVKKLISKLRTCRSRNLSCSCGRNIWGGQWGSNWKHGGNKWAQIKRLESQVVQQMAKIYMYMKKKSTAAQKSFENQNRFAFGLVWAWELACIESYNCVNQKWLTKSWMWSQGKDSLEVLRFSTLVCFPLDDTLTLCPLFANPCSEQLAPHTFNLTALLKAALAARNYDLEQSQKGSDAAVNCSTQYV